MNRPQEPWRASPKARSRLPLFLLVGISTGALIALLAWRFPDALKEHDSWAHLIYLLGFLVLIASGAFHRGLRARQTVQHALIWIGIAGIAVLGYAYRFELNSIKNRVLGELIPGAGIQVAGGEVQFRANTNGSFIIETLVNDIPVRFLVDTGASDVVLSPRDAKRIGLNLDQLDFSRRYQTANGIIKGAPIKLGTIRVGTIVIPNVAGSVNGAPLNDSLLGMSFLERLTSYRVENGTLILRQ